MALQLPVDITFMTKNNKKYEILFFYSTSKYESVKTKLFLNNYLISNSVFEKCVFKEIEIEKDTEICKKYNVIGVPTTIFFHNKSLFYRHLGELSNKELDSMFERISLIIKKN